ncbi:MAG: protein jag [Oscillospiraceae bacterium]|nr:protein jag [Oscillospiraceae bacterium]
MKNEIFSGRSIEEAKAKAVESFGVTADKIKFTVLEDVKTGLFGRIKSEAKVQAEYEEPVVQEAVAETVQTSAVSDAAEVTEIAENTDNEIKEIPAEKLEICHDFISKILDKMEIECSVNVQAKDGGIVADIDSKGSGAVIGRRGETLDALQYLSSLVVNKGEGDYIRITLDSCGYRDKRAETLKSLAEKISNKVLKSGRSTVLEPMNPYERRIIHSTVVKIDGVNSKSIGEEPYRKVVIASDNPRKGNRNRRGRDGHRPYREPRSLDLKTSFEKDYKKPRPEDDINAGLYGKIEL